MCSPRPHDRSRGFGELRDLRTAVTRVFLFILLMSGFAAGPIPASACPFCAAVSPSLSDRLAVARFAIVGRISGEVDLSNRYVREVEFAALRYLKGSAEELGDQPIMAPIPQAPAASQHYFTMGAREADIAGSERLVWSLPTPISSAAADYIATLSRAPVETTPRVAYFVAFLNDPDPLIARDAYDEFGAAPYADVKAVAEMLPRAELKQWVSDESIDANSRRLFLTLLGVCGSEEDAHELLPLIEQSVATAGADLALDAMIACYLTLRGAAGLQAIETSILRNESATLGDLQSTVLALRFHGEEEERIDRPELLNSMRLLLDRPDAADLVIRDLARWEDWSVLDRVVELFRQTGEQNSFLRVPIVKYLQACPLPEAAAALGKIEAEFPAVVARANVMPFELGQRRDQTPVSPDTTNAGTTNAGTRNGAQAQLPAEQGTPNASDSGPMVSVAEAPANAEQLQNEPETPEEGSADLPNTPAAPGGFFTNRTVGLLLAAVGLLAGVVIFLILRSG